MLKSLLKTQRKLWLRGVQANSAVVFMMVMFLFYGLAGAALMGAMMWFETSHGHPESLATVLAAGVLGYLMLVIMLPAGENHLQPEDFLGFEISPGQLLKAHLITAIYSSRGVTGILVTVITTVFFAAAIPPVWIALLIPAMVLQYFLMIVVAELLSAKFASQKSRHSKERTTIVSSLLLLVMILGYNFLITQSGAHVTLADVAPYVRWTPLGSAGGAVAAAIDGHWLLALAQCAITVLTLALALWWWQRSVASRLAAPLDKGETQVSENLKVERGGAYLPLVPRTPAGAIYSRALRYFRRDPRLLNSLIAAPIMSVFFAFQAISMDLDLQFYLGLWMLAFMSATISSNDFGFDGPATWMYMESGVPPRTVTMARHLASMTIPFVYAVFYSIAIFYFVHDRATASFLIPAGLLMFVVASAIAQVATVYNPYPTAKPGTSPWQDKSGYSSGAFLTVFATLFLAWIPLVPGVALLMWHDHNGPVWALAMGWLLLIAMPVLSWVMARKFAAKHIDAHLPDVFAKVKHHV
ncbi:hypothetical protein QVA66_01730 [Staphylococcus chromogenes]|nr:hypothetical protein [Staphylococcus chromogenes]